VWPAGSALFFVAVSTFYVLVSLSLGLIFSATSTTAAEAVQKKLDEARESQLRAKGGSPKAEQK